MSKFKEIEKTVPTSAEFSETLGHVTWLMTLDKEWQEKPIKEIERYVSAPLMFKQVRVYKKGKQPLAAIIWALVSPQVKAALEIGGYEMKLEDWRSGSEIVIVACVSPFVENQKIKEQFQSDNKPKFQN